MRYFTGAVLAAAVLSTAACDKPADSKPTHGPPPVSVELVTVPRQPIRDVLDLVGQLEAEESVMIKPETEGILESVEFQDGDEVRKGALLFRLRDDEQQARMDEATALLSLARDEYERAKTLAEKHTVSAAELDRATSAWQAAKARRDLARVALQRMEIRAPFDGVLGARQVSPGDRVDDNRGLVRIDSVARLRLAFTVPEIGVRAVRTGVPLEIGVSPYPAEKFPGEVYFVAPSLDPDNRRLLLKAWVPNPKRKLRPGLFANIEVEIARHDEALVVPEAAVAYDAKGPFVWRIVDGDVAERAAVEIGIRQRGRMEIVSGLNAGDRIVSAGTHKVSLGAHVKEVPPPPPAEASP